MIAITTRSSIRVNPRFLELNCARIGRELHEIGFSEGEEENRSLRHLHDRLASSSAGLGLMSSKNMVFLRNPQVIFMEWLMLRICVFLTFLVQCQDLSYHSIYLVCVSLGSP